MMQQRKYVLDLKTTKLKKGGFQIRDTISARLEVLYSSTSMQNKKESPGIIRENALDFNLYDGKVNLRISYVYDQYHKVVADFGCGGVFTFTKTSVSSDARLAKNVKNKDFSFDPSVIACAMSNAYTYLDEAHSIGAVGKTGRGVCELLGVDTADVDVMIGTFTKSFGSCGGYIAGSKELIQYLKYTCPAHIYGTSVSPPAAQQIISSIKVILGEDGSNRGAQKLARIRENSNFFRSELQKMGFEVLGDNDSPVMPIMLYNPAKIPAFSRECLKRNVAVVTVAFRATPLLLARARICISASHSREDLIKALEVGGGSECVLSLIQSSFIYVT